MTEKKAKLSRKKGFPQIFAKDITPAFSNYAEITHGDDEFCFTFMHMFLKHTNVPRGQVMASVTVTPKHAKRILKALEQNIDKYESKFGEIKLPEEEKEPKLSYRV